jgi:hypothetical protein
MLRATTCERKVRQRMKRIVALLICIAVLIPGAATALANSSQSSYGQSDVQSVSGSRSSAASSPSTNSASTGSLPFTGLDVGALAVGGIVLLGAGIAVRRMSAPDKP